MTKVTMSLALTLTFYMSLMVLAQAKKQTVKVQGRVFCPSSPNQAVNIKVKFVDEDRGPNPDDVMAETRTDEEGKFYMEGTEDEWTNIDPRVKIYHDCNDGVTPCSRKWKITIPDRYINKDMVFDMGTLNLEMIMDEEERDCFH